MKLGNRKAAEQQLFADLDEFFMDGGVNSSLYKTKFAKLSDEEFHEFVQQLKKGDTFFCAQKPLFGKAKNTPATNVAKLREWGYEVYQQLIMPAVGDCPSYLSPVKYMTLYAPFGRQRQLQVKKVSIPDNVNTTDLLTGQPAGDSAAGRISGPELNNLAARDMRFSLKELITVRGGDKGRFNAMNTAIDRQGYATIAGTDRFASGVESKWALHAYLTAMHLSNTLIQDGK